MWHYIRSGLEGKTDLFALNVFNDPRPKAKQTKENRRAKAEDPLEDRVRRRSPKKKAKEERKPERPHAEALRFRSYSRWEAACSPFGVEGRRWTAKRHEPGRLQRCP